MARFIIRTEVETQPWVPLRYLAGIKEVLDRTPKWTETYLKVMKASHVLDRAPHEPHLVRPLGHEAGKKKKKRSQIRPCVENF